MGRRLTPEQREANRQRSIAWYYANREQQLARGAAWREANRARQRAAVSAWKKRNPDQHVAHQQARRARAAQAGGTYNASDVKRLYDAQRGRCAYCQRPLDNYHVDHRTPLSRGGSNGPDNLALACPPCNTRKRHRTAEEFMGVPA